MILLIWLATNWNVLVFPTKFDLNLNLITDDENCVKSSSNSSSKLESTKIWLSGSTNVIFLFAWDNLRIKYSSEEIVWSFVVFWVNLKLILSSVNVKVYLEFDIVPVLAVLTKLPFASPLKVVFSDAKLAVIGVKSSCTTGELIFVKSMILFPKDSSIFKIPSLSISISKLSIMPSLS